MHRAEIFALIEIPSVSSGITEWEHGGGAVAPRRRSAKQPHQKYFMSNEHTK